MKNWQALLLGSTMMKPIRGSYHLPVDYSGCPYAEKGCALGMIDRGSGVLGADEITPSERRDEAFFITPLSKLQYVQQYLPCGCDGTTEIMWGGGMRVVVPYEHRNLQYIIVHLFNQHVCDGGWSIEQLAEWLRGIEEAMDAEAAPTQKTSSPVEKVLDMVEV